MDRLERYYSNRNFGAEIVFSPYYQMRTIYNFEVPSSYREISSELKKISTSPSWFTGTMTLRIHFEYGVLKKVNLCLPSSCSTLFDSAVDWPTKVADLKKIPQLVFAVDTRSGGLFNALTMHRIKVYASNNDEICCVNGFKEGNTCRCHGDQYGPLWEGDHCETSIPCVKPCVNGHCQYRRCVCDKHWTGDSCDIEISCDSSFCKNGGTCRLGKCVCPPTHTGYRCGIANEDMQKLATGYKLVGNFTTLSTTTAMNGMACYLHCRLNSNCKSVNFNIDTRECNLLDSDQDTVGNSIECDDQWVFVTSNLSLPDDIFSPEMACRLVSDCKQSECSPNCPNGDRWIGQCNV